MKRDPRASRGWRNVPMTRLTAPRTWILAVFAVAATAGGAQAIPLPDFGTCNTNGNCLGITNQNTSSGAMGIRGWSFAPQGGGVFGGTTNNQGYGVLGDASVNNGTGVRGDSGGGVGVRGVSWNGDGIEGSTASAVKSGAYLHNDHWNGGYGVFASANGVGHAVHGRNDSANGWAGYFEGRVFTTTSYQSSDARLKKDIKSVAYGLDQIAQLRPVTFRWKERRHTQALQIGLIAQEVQKIIPEVVNTDEKSGMMSVNYTALVPVMMKALQEQQAQIKRLEEERAPLAASMFGMSGFDRALLLASIPG